MSTLLHSGRSTAQAVVRATRIAGAALRTKFARDERREDARRHLHALLASSTGLGHKVSQMMGSGTPPASAPPQIPLEELVPLLSPRLRERLEVLQRRGQGASVAQVHRGRLSDGRIVALKFLRPGMREAFEAECRLVRALPLPPFIKRWSFDRNRYEQELQRALDEELDLELELKRQRSFGRRNGDPRLVTPRVFPELSSADVLVQEWETSAPFANAASWDAKQRHQIIETLALATLRGLFAEGIAHADLHPGNVGVRQGPQGIEVVLYDYGSTVKVSDRAQRALGRLLCEATEGSLDAPLALACLVDAGFDADLLESMDSSLSVLLSLLLEPFARSGPTNHRKDEMGDHIDRQVGDTKWLFRAAAPAELLLALRALAAIPRLARLLDVPLNWPELFRAAVGEERMETLSLYRPRTQRGRAATTAKLRIEVSRPERRPIKVALPVARASALDELLDADLRDRIRARGLKLDSLISFIRMRGEEPGEIFSIEDDEGQVRAWIG